MVGAWDGDAPQHGPTPTRRTIDRSTRQICASRPMDTNSCRERLAAYERDPQCYLTLAQIAEDREAIK